MTRVAGPLQRIRHLNGRNSPVTLVERLDAVLEDVPREHAKLAEKGRKEGKSGLSPMIIHHVHACLHKACKDAVRWGLIGKNPLDAADPPCTKGDGTKEMKTWTAEQLGAFLAFVQNERLSALWHLYAMSGMRRGEALGGYAGSMSTSRTRDSRSVEL